MTDLSRLVEAPACSSLPYIDPALPDRPLVLYAARPRDYDVRTPVLFVHHGVGRNGRDYRDYWLNLVDKARVLAISIEFPEASFPEHLWYHLGNLHDKDGTPNRREEWTFGIDERLFDQLRAQASRPGNTTDCSVTPRAGSLCTEWSHSDTASASPSPSVPMQAPMRCRIWRRLGHSASARRMSIPMHCVRCSASASR
jgi:hypothetical protein